MNKSNFLIVLLLLAVLGSTAIALSIASHAHSIPAEDSEKLLAITPPTQGEQRLEVEVITATENGFDPTVITRPRGPFILAVHNVSGEAELVLRLARIRGEHLQELRLRSGRRSNHQRLDLSPGDYIISEAAHPAWSCALTITN